MGSINNSIDKARKIGRFAAETAKALHDGAAVTAGTDSHHPGDDTGILVLDAYRTQDVNEMKGVVKGYQDGYNERATELGTSPVDWAQIKSGIGWALSGATDEEEGAIPAAM